MARNVELERALIADPDDVATYLVYADWLQSENDPRGELIARMIHAESARASDAKHRAMMAAVMRRLADPLVGELADLDPQWHRGFFARVVLDSERLRAPFAERLAALFRDPSAALLRSIRLRDPFAKEDPPAAIAALARGAPRSLRAVTLEFDGDVGDLEALYALDRIELLDVGYAFASRPDFWPRYAAVSGAAVRSIARAPWPLDSLALRFEGGDATIDDLVGVLARDFPLTSLEINFASGDRSFASGLCRALVDSPFAPTLTRLSLGVPALARADYQLLLAHRERLESLSDVRVPSRTYQARLATQ